MRKILFIILLILLLQTPRGFKASALEQNPDGADPPQSSIPQKSDGYAESEDDIFSANYERELLSRRFFQKTLPPLSSREKIVWSFKTARANILL
ncbi:MAG TPA: hypothetical protein VMZ49_03155 [Patescibacteria group bacterium]|nr:hypothetical protein [Patescibacteria group bacterium]